MTSALTGGCVRSTIHRAARTILRGWNRNGNDEGPLNLLINACLPMKRERAHYITLPKRRSSHNSWQQMFVRQPPIQQMFVGDDSSRHWHVVRAAEGARGLTLDDLHQYFMAFNCCTVRYFPARGIGRVGQQPCQTEYLLTLQLLTPPVPPKQDRRQSPTFQIRCYHMMEEHISPTNEIASDVIEQPGGNRTTNNDKINKACESCRSSKLRCIVEEDSPDGICKRCRDTSRLCVFKAARVRQRRKLHVDARVAELERQLRALRVQLHQAQQATSTNISSWTPPAAGGLRFEAPVTPASWPGKSATVNEDLILHDEVGRSFDLASQTPGRVVRSIAGTSDDVVERNILSWQEADRLVEVYFDGLAIHYPFVTLPAYRSTEKLRAERPVTFLAILAAASVTAGHDLNTALNHELLALLARRIMLEGEHTLDLVQAITVVTIWYAPLDKFESLRHYQFAHLAATIAMDIGLGDEGQDNGEEEIDEEGWDRRRTLLGIYHLCTGISVTTGRPKMLRFTPYKQKCIDLFKARRNLSYQDRWFIAWVELQRISEVGADMFFTKALDISEPKNQTLVNDFCKKLDFWRDDHGLHLNGALEIHYHYTRSMVLCVVLYVDHDLEDFRPPFRVRPLDAQAPPSAKLTPFVTRTVMALVDTIHSALDAFLQFDAVNLLAAPIVYYIRTLHPFTILLMLDMVSRRPENEIGKILDENTLKVSYYFQAFHQMLQGATDSEARRTPSRFWAIIKRMERWWLLQVQHSTKEADDLRPFAKMQPSGASHSHSLPKTETAQASPDLRHPSKDSESERLERRHNVVTPKTQVPGLLAHSQLDIDRGITPLLEENWVMDMDQVPASFLMPEIDWALFEGQGALDTSTLVDT
ncbi:hypothetical protein AC579_4240 [Pseudocercospora musae]|uniref:Zn(2)-C6 fungal-type domain-containing protein n=1 Tax=Pseudocercospora musae TaxID=113226 RepID=A0A139IFH6_9PEZI|nr:hypothetical protein AC579_4240 [Pseudocercospora musae]KXT13454.1 hypothetical protein AC579_4240 [Pseudocercospora musae]